jgi:hypothetical protein
VAASLERRSRCRRATSCSISQSSSAPRLRRSSEAKSVRDRWLPGSMKTRIFVCCSFPMTHAVCAEVGRGSTLGHRKVNYGPIVAIYNVNRDNALAMARTPQFFFRCEQVVIDEAERAAAEVSTEKVPVSAKDGMLAALVAWVEADPPTRLRWISRARGYAHGLSAQQLEDQIRAQAEDDADHDIDGVQNDRRKRSGKKRNTGKKVG